MTDTKISNYAVALERIAGLFVGQLDADELRLLGEAVERGDARYSYEGGPGFMGLAKVRLTMIPKARADEDRLR